MAERPITRINELPLGASVDDDAYFVAYDPVNEEERYTPSQMADTILKSGIKSVASIADLPTATGSGNKVSVTSYIPGYAARGDGLPRGGGEFVDGSGRHNGGAFIDPNRASEIGTAAYYIDSGVDVDCWVRTTTKITPFSFGAIGDLSAVDSIQVQAAADYCITNQTPLYPEDGRYLIDDSIVLTGQLELLGSGGFDKSVFVGMGSAIFTYTSLDLCRFEHLSLRATSPACKGFEQTNLQLYTYNCTWIGCDFFYSLSECIYGNLILCEINGNSFGYHGPAAPAQTQHRHIFSQGDEAASTTNINHILRNKFYNANGVTESCYFESGYRLNVIGNTFETNDCSAMTWAGMSDITFEMNWVENNNAMFAINIKNNPEASIGNYIVDINKNRFVSVYAGAYIADVTGSSEITNFNGNQISGTFFEVTPGNTTIVSSYGNNVVGGSCTLPDDHIGILWITDQFQVPTLPSSPAYKEGRVYYNTALGKLRVAGAIAWETVTSS